MKTDVALNLTEIDCIDASGIGLVIECHSSLKPNGGSLKVFGVRDEVGRMLSETGIDTIVPVYNAEEEMLKSGSS
jgi:anti-anti-sigma factor